MKKNIFLFCLSVVFTLVFAEILARVVWFYAMDKRLEFHSPKKSIFEKSANHRLLYVHKKSFESTNAGRKVITNEFGQRIMPGHSTFKPNPVLMLGDSVAFGYMIEVSDSLPVLLEKMIGDDNISVINAGVAGYNLPQVLELSKELMPIYRPKLTVYLLHLNDFAYDGCRAADAGLPYFFDPPKFKLGIYFNRLVYEYHLLIAKDWYEWCYQMNEKKTLKILEALKGQIEGQQCRLVICILPLFGGFNGYDHYPQTVLVQKIKKALNGTGIESIDLRESFVTRGILDNNQYRLDSWHPNEKGYKKLAEVIAEELKARGCFPKT
jgi:lysophospholipase L1-like esterase